MSRRAGENGPAVGILLVALPLRELVPLRRSAAQSKPEGRFLAPGVRPQRSGPIFTRPEADLMSSFKTLKEVGE